MNVNRQLSRARTLLLLAIAVAAPVSPAWAGSDVSIAGTYAIDGAKDLQSRGLYHFLYLHPNGKFIMAAEWAGNESSRAAGHWSVAGEELTLVGAAHVQTNQGAWEVPYRRVFRIEIQDRRAARLTPVPEKNRFGMLGWPNAYVYVTERPQPPFPNQAVPADEGKLLALMDTLMVPKTGSIKAN